MNKKTISLIILMPIIIFLSFSIKNQIKADNDDPVEHQVSETLNEEIQVDKLTKIYAKNDESTYIYLDTNLRKITLFNFVGNTKEFDSSFKYDEFDSAEYDGEKFEWGYRESDDGTSLIWAISANEGVVTVKGKALDQKHVTLENGLHVYFIKNKTKIDLPLEVELEHNE